MIGYHWIYLFNYQIFTGSPFLTTVIKPTILAVIRDGHKASFHVTAPDCTGFFFLSVVIKIMLWTLNECHSC